MKNRNAHILLTGMLLTGFACAPGVGTVRDAATLPAAEGMVQLNVTNHGSGPMEIFAIGSGTYYRMGTVLPGFVSHFILRRAMIASGPVEFLARAGSGGPPARSDRLLLAPGDEVDFKLTTSHTTSIATVRPRRVSMGPAPPVSRRTWAASSRQPQQAP